MKKPIIETERLILREIHSTDVDDVYSGWMRDEEVSRCLLKKNLA